MAWPLSQDYNEAIQSPATCLADPELKAGGPATNALGIPQPRSGNFADVYEFHCPAAGTRWAVKCFTREVKGLRERYAEVSEYLQQARLPFTVEFHYLEQGMRIRGSWYPVLKMRWVEGLLLNEFVRDNLDKPARLQALSQIWLRMAKRLREAGLAHADLQHGNVILVPGSMANSLAVKLIDYDGMFVPALAGKKSGEVGHPNYQHPQRLKEGTYSAEVDRFPLLVVATALRVLAAPGGKALWQRYDNGDNLLFKETDLRAPSESALFKELRQASDPLTKKLVGALEKGCAGRLKDVPLLEELLPEEKPATRTAIKGQGGVARAAGAAGDSPDWDFDREGPAPARPVRRRGKAVPPWAWAAGGAVAATLVVGGILLATRKGPEKAPEVAQNDQTPKVSRPKKPAPIKPVVPPPDRPPQLVPGEREGDKPPREPADPAPVVDVRPRPDPVVAPLPPAGGASPLDRLNPEKIPAADRLPGVKELVAVLPGLGAGPDKNIALSPDGKFLATGFPNGHFNGWVIDDEKPRHCCGLAFSKPIRGLAFTPDSKTVIVGCKGELHLLDWNGTTFRQERHSIPAGDYFALSPDGRTLAYARDKDIGLLDLSADKPRDKGFVLKQHEAEILWLAIFPDGRRLASAGRDGSVRLWDLGRTPPAPMGSITDVPRDPILGLAVSPDGKALAKGTEKGTLELRDFDSGFQSKVRFRKRGLDGGITSISFAPDSRTFITTGGGAGAARSQLIWWNTADGSKRAEWTLPAPCFAGAFAVDGRHVALTCDNGKVYILRLSPAPAEKAPPVSAPQPTLIARTPAAGVKVLTRPRWSVSTEAKESTTVAVHPDNKHFLYGEKDGTIRFADLGTGRVVRTLTGGHTRHVARLVVAANGKQLLSTGFDGVACIWDLQTWRIGQRFTRHTENWFVNGALSPDGKHALTWQSYKDDSVIYVWDTSTGEVLAEAKGSKPSYIANAQFFLDGRRILLARGSLLAPLPLQLWDPDKKLETRYFEGLEKTKPHFISDLALSGDGQKLLTQFGHCLALIQTRSGTPLWQVEMEPMYLARGALSSDGRLALAFGGVANGKSVDCFIPVISASRGQEVCRIAAAGYLEDGTFTPDGRQVLAMTRKELTLWDLPAETAGVAPDPVVDVRPKPEPKPEPAPVTGKDGLIRALPRSSHVIALCAADAAGHRIVIEEGSEAVLWNVDTGKEERRFRGHTQGVTALAVSPDGSRLLSTSTDQTMRLWDLATGKERKKFEHAIPVYRVAFSHDGKYGLSGTDKPSKDEMGNDCYVHLWDLTSGVKLHSFEGLSSPNHLQFSPDDRQVLATSNGSEIVVWEVASKKRVTQFNPRTGPVVCALPDGKHLVMDAGNALQLWDLAARRKVRDFPMRGGHRPPGAVSADGRWLVTGDANPTPEGGRAVTDFAVRLWEIATGREVARFKGHPKTVHYIAISPDGSRAFSGSHDRTVCVWDLKNPGTSAVAAAPVPPPEVEPAEKPTRVVKNPLFKGIIDGAVGSRSFPMPRRFDITKGWELSLEVWIPDLDKTGLIFFIGDERGGKDPIFIEHSKGQLNFCVDNAFTSERQSISTPINRKMLRKWTPMTFRYIPSSPELRVYLNRKLVARERCTVTPKIDRPMRIWICSENTNNQRFFGKVRSVRLANMK